MKPFDLERAKAGAKLVTRDGREARFVAHVPECHQDYRVVAVIGGDDEPSMFAENGSLYSGAEYGDDLLMAPETRTVYVNLYMNGAAEWHATEERAREGLHARATKIAVPVTFEV